MSDSYFNLSSQDARSLLRLLRGQPSSCKVRLRLEGDLTAYLERFEPKRRRRDDRIRKLADQDGVDGALEFDHNAVVSEGDENGAYVMAWHWVDFSGTRLDKDRKA